MDNDETPVTPVEAVMFAWSMQQIYSADDGVRSVGLGVEESYEERLRLLSQRNKQGDPAYLGMLIPSVDAALKNLETYLKHRDDHFKQDEDLRTDQIDAIKQLDQFALNVQTALPKIASSVAIGGVAGLSLSGTLMGLGLSPTQVNLVILSLLGVGYLATEAFVVPFAARRMQRQVEILNKRKRTHYVLYIGRCKDELTRLLGIMRAAYEKAYGTKFMLPVIDGKIWSVEDTIPVQEAGDEQRVP
jgi:hypothetical protein